MKIITKDRIQLDISAIRGAGVHTVIDMADAEGNHLARVVFSPAERETLVTAIQSTAKHKRS